MRAEQAARIEPAEGQCVRSLHSSSRSLAPLLVALARSTPRRVRSLRSSSRSLAPFVVAFARSTPRRGSVSIRQPKAPEPHQRARLVRLVRSGSQFRRVSTQCVRGGSGAPHLDQRAGRNDTARVRSASGPRRFFGCYRAACVRSASGPRPLPFSPLIAPAAVRPLATLPNAVHRSERHDEEWPASAMGPTADASRHPSSSSGSHSGHVAAAPLGPRHWLLRPVRLSCRARSVVAFATHGVATAAAGHDQGGPQVGRPYWCFWPGESSGAPPHLMMSISQVPNRNPRRPPDLDNIRGAYDVKSWSEIATPR
eukprot:gene25379-biopygen6004